MPALSVEGLESVVSALESIKGVLFRSEHLTHALRALRVVQHRLTPEPHEADFRFLADPAWRGGLLLDLGANIGHSAISALKVQPDLRVLSIEANPACESGLKMARRLLGSRFSYRIIGVGRRSGYLDFHVPVRSSRMLLEEGTFDRHTLDAPASVARMGQAGRDYQVHCSRIPLTTVDALGVNPTVVKMDLQGLELDALVGMEDTLRRCRPALLIERGEQHEAVRDWLLVLGYVACRWDGRRVVEGESDLDLNAIFLPPAGALRARPRPRRA